MPPTDTIADYLVRIRNAIKAKHRKVDIPASRVKRELSRILLENGYIKNYTNIDDGQIGLIRIYLKYDQTENNAILGLKRISKPGLRRYVGVPDIPRVRNNLGIAILSTPKGIVTGREARRLGVGGEVLCEIW